MISWKHLIKDIVCGFIVASIIYLVVEFIVSLFGHDFGFIDFTIPFTVGWVGWGFIRGDYRQVQ